MKRPVQYLSSIACLIVLAAPVLACEYTAGETKFADYASCRYGEESIVVVDLPEGSGWEHCVYYTEAFRPPKLLAITTTENGKEVAVPNDRSQIGNPCYLIKQKCDKAFKAQKNAGD